MNQKTAVSIQAKRATPVPGGILQRKCACGQHASGGECDECRAKKQSLQRKEGRFKSVGVPPVGHGALASFEESLDPAARTLRELHGATTATGRFAHDFSQLPMLRPEPVKIQTKLIVNTSGDRYEQEADRVADQVIRMPDVKLQRACTCGGKCPKCQSRAGQPNQERNSLHTRYRQSSDSGSFAAPPIVHEVLRSPGQPLDLATRRFMESRFRHDFSGVRTHTDSRAAESARSVVARAYTVGTDIVFDAGEYNPLSVSGRRLIAHELTHVLQQSSGGASETVIHDVPALSQSDSGLRVTPRSGLVLSRADPITYLRCRQVGVPCPTFYFGRGAGCPLVDCIPAATANLPFAISPGVCIFRCLDGTVCACVLVGSRTSAVCTFTFCDSPGSPSSSLDYQDLADRAIAEAERQMPGSPEQGQTEVA